MTDGWKPAPQIALARNLVVNVSFPRKVTSFSFPGGSRSVALSGFTNFFSPSLVFNV